MEQPARTSSLVGTSPVLWTGDRSAGLYDPIAVAAMTFLVALLMLHETRDVKMWEET